MDIDRMFRCELAAKADQPAESDLWGDFHWETPFDDIPDIPQQTVHLSDVSLLTPVPHSAPPLTDSPTDSYTPSSEDMSSDDFELADPDFFPSPVSVDPSSLITPTASTRPSRRGSRSMTKIPVPIPNLTKKSRGRKVPTSNGEPIYAASRDKTKRGVRTYTCHVEGCGKCFVRGEHLKRHIRSIHTEEKPWLCTYEHCTRSFSRRDNLNQHLRIHKLQGDDD